MRDVRVQRTGGGDEDFDWRDVGKKERRLHR